MRGRYYAIAGLRNVTIPRWAVKVVLEAGIVALQGLGAWPPGTLPSPGNAGEPAWTSGRMLPSTGNVLRGETPGRSAVLLNTPPGVTSWARRGPSSLPREGNEGEGRGLSLSTGLTERERARGRRVDGDGGGRILVGSGWSFILAVTTGEAEDAAVRLGMARGTGRSALSRLSRLGILGRGGRGLWPSRILAVTCAWPGECVLRLAEALGAGVGREARLELGAARFAFERACREGWGSDEERDWVRAVARGRMLEAWDLVRLAKRGPAGETLPIMGNVGGAEGRAEERLTGLVVAWEPSSRYRDAEGIRRLALLASRGLALGAAVVRA